jgi:TRAP-type C4-dicarboxylate transport system substrate-binding protein
MKRLILKTLAAAVAAGTLCAANAQDVKERAFKVALQNPKGHPLVTGAEKFAEIVAAKSGGKLKLNLFPGGTLGSDAASVSALQGGTVEIVILNSGILASQVKAFEIYDFPFMFATPQEADAVVDGPFGTKLHAMLADKGIVGLAELYAALEQKAVDGQENPVSVILANKFAEVQKYLTLTHHQYNPQSVIFSRKVWDTLSADERRILQDAAHEAARFQRQVSRDAASGALEQLRKAGMQVTEFSPAETARLREKMKPVIDRNAASVGEALVRELQSALAAARK